MDAAKELALIGCVIVCHGAAYSTSIAVLYSVLESIEISILTILK